MLLDTSAWIEYLIGSEKGKKVEDVLKNNSCFTSIISIAELAQWSARENKPLQPNLDAVQKHSIILDVDEEIVTLAGAINHFRKKSIKNWGMIDSIIVATSVVSDLNIVTKDKRFSDLKNVVQV